MTNFRITTLTPAHLPELVALCNDHLAHHFYAKGAGARVCRAFWQMEKEKGEGER